MGNDRSVLDVDIDPFAGDQRLDPGRGMPCGLLEGLIQDPWQAPAEWHQRVRIVVDIRKRDCNIPTEQGGDDLGDG